MERSPTLSEIFQAVLEAKRNINPPAKNKKAVYGRYADLEAILTAVEPALAEQGLVITQAVFTNEFGPFLRTNLVHAESGQSITSEVPLLSKDKNDPQKLGSAITYARRYGITALLSIVADDDDDGNTGSGRARDGGKAKEAPKAKGVSQERIEEVMKGGGLDQKILNGLIREFERAGFEKSDVVPETKAVLGREFGQLSDLTEAEARTVVGHVRKVKSGDAERMTGDD